MKKVVVFLCVLCCLMAVVYAAGRSEARDSGGVVTIEYWQYFFQSKVEIIDDLIVQFERANPNIRVVHSHFPYDAYIQRVITAIPAGQGPEMINLFYGWLPEYVKEGIVQPLPRADFSPEYFRDNFFPFVERSVQFNNQYYSVPTAVRTLALVWNKDLFRAAGLDPERPPRTLDELADYARRLTRYDAQGNMIQAGLSMMPTQQGHNWLRDILIRQFGGVPYSPDGRRVTYNTPQGVQALTWYTDRIRVDRVGHPAFVINDVAGMTGNLVAMAIDGSFRIGTYINTPGLDWGATEVPSHNGIRANYASFWTNSIVNGVRGERLDASVQFLKFLASRDVQAQWLTRVGELPANPAFAAQQANVPFVGEFLKGLEYAHATAFVNEAGQRDIFVDMIDQVILRNVPPAEAMRQAAEREQRLIDEFWR